MTEEPGGEPAEAMGLAEPAEGLEVPVDGAGAAPEILASRLWTEFWRSTSCWLSLPRRDLISSRLSERPWTWVDMGSRRAPELAWTSWTDFWSELMVVPSLLTLSPDCSTSVLMTVWSWITLSESS